MPINPLKVSLDNIIPLTFARDHFSQIVSEVQQDKLFVLTKGGKPAVAIIDVKYLESITGGQVQKENITEEIKKDPEKVGLPPMVEHKPFSPPPPLPKPAGFAAPQTFSAQAPQPLKPQPKAGQPLAEKPFEPPKPAGFAAPSFAKATEDKPQPKPVTPPPPQPKVDRPLAEKPVPPPPPASKPFDPAQGKPQTPISPLQMPTVEPRPTSPVPEKSPAIPNKPLVNLPPVNQQSNNPSGNVDIQFAPDDEKKELDGKDGEWTKDEKTAPDDENSPAQYAGEKDTSNPPADRDSEPEDMALD